MSQLRRGNEMSQLRRGNEMSQLRRGNALSQLRIAEGPVHCHNCGGGQCNASVIL